MLDDVAAVPAGPRRRRVLAALGLVAAALFGYVATHRYPAAPPRPEPPDRIAADPGPDLPRLTGDRGPGPAGLRLLVGGAYPQVLDTHTGRAAPVPGLRLLAGQRVRLQSVPVGIVGTVTSVGSARTRTVLLPTGGGARCSSATTSGCCRRTGAARCSSPPTGRAGRRCP